VSTEWSAICRSCRVKLLSALMERAGSSLLPHDLSRMLGRSVALKGCAMAPRQAGFGP
jgi:hypothetical protein